MARLNSAPTLEAITHVLKTLAFQLPDWYITELSKNHTLLFDFDEGKSVELWPLVEIIKINLAYKADEHYPGYFLIGTDGGGEACAIEKQTGSIYFLLFIGSLPDDALYVGETLEALLEYLRLPW